MWLGIEVAIAAAAGWRFFEAGTDRIMANNDRTMSGVSPAANAVRRRREARGWSQAELAGRAEISRAAVSAIEGAHLSPSVATALALAAVFECSVEELFGRPQTAPPSPAGWAWAPRGEAARYWEAEVASRRLLYPVEAAGLNPAPHDGVCQHGVMLEAAPVAPEKTLVMASCDPAAGLLAAEYARASGFRLLVFPRGGRAALELLRRKLVHVAGLHFSTDDAPERNATMAAGQLPFALRLLRLARWQSGIALASEDHSRSPESVARRSVRWAAREPGSAARECLDELLGRRAFDGRVVSGHASVAEAVRSGWAGAGVCVRFSAEEAGLNFLPLRNETLDFCFAAPFQHDPRLQALARLLQSRAWRRLASELPGYDARETGEMPAL
jgi:molybdate-binding protein/transcriptional regulator with XRE-family HTH domain